MYQGGRGLDPWVSMSWGVRGVSNARKHFLSNQNTAYHIVYTVFTKPLTYVQDSNSTIAISTNLN